MSACLGLPPVTCQRLREASIFAVLFAGLFVCFVCLFVLFVFVFVFVFVYLVAGVAWTLHTLGGWNTRPRGAGFECSFGSCQQ